MNQQTVTRMGTRLPQPGLNYSEFVGVPLPAFIAKKVPTLPEHEPDNERRAAHIFLMKTALIVGGAESTFNHWFLKIEFNNSVVFIEGLNYDRQLRGSFEMNTQRDGTQHRINEEKCMAQDLHEIQTSPAELLEIARDNGLNTEDYNLAMMNCTHWATRAAIMIGNQQIGRQ